MVEMIFRILKTAALVAVALSVAATCAQAGRYHVYSCRTPAGESAPADGWSGSVGAGGAADNYAKNTCAEHGALIAALGEQTTHLVSTDRVTWAFEAPEADRVVGMTLWRAGYLHGASGEKATYEFTLSAPRQTAIFDECVYGLECHGQGDSGVPMASANQLVVPGAYLGSHLYVSIACALGLAESECGNGFHDPNGYAAVVYLYAADLTLEQSAGPSASNVSGELASAPAVSGTSDVAFSASDPGAGVYEAVFSVDGQAVQSSVVDENGGRCRNVGQTTDDLAAFDYLQPCPASVSADVGFDTTKVSDGPHHLVVSVIDAAGNAAPVLDRNVTISNPPPPGVPGPANGAGASTQATLTASWTRTRRERMTCAYGRAQTIVGRLTGPAGAPIAGAQIDVTATPANAGAQPLTMTSPQTGPDGRFTLRLPSRISSRTLRFAYRAHVGDALPVATRTLALGVRAGISLSIAPRTASVGRSIDFRGRLLGGPIPRDGKQLVLEARSPGGPWIEFDVVRTDSHGRYRASYRFKFPGPADYQFRVRSEVESDYPFAAGSSGAVSVFER